MWPCMKLNIVPVATICMDCNRMASGLNVAEVDHAKVICHRYFLIFTFVAYKLR